MFLQRLSYAAGDYFARKQFSDSEELCCVSHLCIDTRQVAMRSKIYHRILRSSIRSSFAQVCFRYIAALYIAWKTDAFVLNIFEKRWHGDLDAVCAQIVSKLE